MSRILQPGILTPICCATHISAKAKDHFLNVNKLFEDSEQTNFVFVDSTDASYLEEDKRGHVEASSATSIFVDKTPEECSQMLFDMCKAGSNIDYETFIIYDPRTIEDSTVLVAGKEYLVDDTTGERQDTPLLSVRMSMDLVRDRLSFYMVDGGLSEDVVRAERREDKVLLRSETRDVLTAEEEERAYGPFDPQTTGTYKLHEPDLADFIPPHRRRELLLDNDTRVLCGDSNPERDWSNEIFFMHGKSARVVKELLGDEKSEGLRPDADSPALDAAIAQAKRDRAEREGKANASS